MPMCIADLYSVSPYSQSYFIAGKKGDNETDLDWETKVWRQRLHTKPDGHVYIPATQFGAAIKNAAPYYPGKVPGTGGKGTYRKHFDSGVFVYEDIVLPLLATDAEGEWLMLPSNPNNPKSGRVPKCMPLIRQWAATVTYIIYDTAITEEVFTEVLRISGIQVGIGRFRPSQKGIYGRYAIKELLWTI